MRVKIFLAILFVFILASFVSAVEIGVTNCVLLEPDEGRGDACVNKSYQSIFSCQGKETQIDPCSTNILDKNNLKLCYEFFIDLNMDEHYKFCKYGCENSKCIVCTENWQCGSWSACINNQQTRTCTDSNSCGTTTNKPTTTQTCTPEDTCTENWQCLPWSECTNNQQERICADLNNCGNNANKPQTSKSCTASQQNNQNSEIPEIQQKPLINNKEVIIETNAEGIKVIKVEDKSVETSLEVIEESQKIYVKTSEGNIEIKITPNQAILKATKIGEVNEIKIEEENGNAFYSINGVKKAYLLFFIPISAEVNQKISITNGNIVSTEKPWWSFLALGI